jgi:hypothetical protein
MAIMKKKLFYTASAAILFSVNCCLGQEKIDKYCAVYLNRTAVFLNRAYKVKAWVNLGEWVAEIKDSTIRSNLLLVNHFQNDVDILDYMSKLGWSVVSMPSLGIIYFKKCFDRSELRIEDGEPPKTSD